MFFFWAMNVIVEFGVNHLVIDKMIFGKARRRFMRLYLKDWLRAPTSLILRDIFHIQPIMLVSRVITP